jgi:hypothetical protein
MQRGVIVLSALLIICVGAADLFAYTYTYDNRTNYDIRLTVELYDDSDKSIQVKALGSKVLVTQFLLKSWIVEVFLNNRWNRVLHLTCDVLPGDHVFSIYVREVKNERGELSQNWNVITDDAIRMNRN